MKIIIHKNPEPEPFRKSLFSLESFDNLIRKGTITSDNTLDFIELAKQNNHIISIGFLGLSHFGALIDFGYKIDRNLISSILIEIFNKKETASLYPFYNLTILPFDINPESYLYFGQKVDKMHNSNDGNGYSFNEIECFIKDALLAENKYIKKEKYILTSEI